MFSFYFFNCGRTNNDTITAQLESVFHYREARLRHTTNIISHKRRFSSNCVLAFAWTQLSTYARALNRLLFENTNSVGKWLVDICRLVLFWFEFSFLLIMQINFKKIHWQWHLRQLKIKIISNSMGLIFCCLKKAAHELQRTHFLRGESNFSKPINSMTQNYISFL